MSSQVKSIVLKTGEHIYYSLVQKQSDSNIMFNERLLVLVEEKYLGYTKDFNKKDLENSIDLNKLKKKIPLENLRRILNINKNLTIMINQYDKFNKLKSIKWLFKLQSEKLAETWTQLLKRQHSPVPSRKTTQQKDRQVDVLSQKKNPSIKEFVRGQQQLSKKQEQIKKSNLLQAQRQQQRQRQRQRQRQKQKQRQRQRQRQRQIQRQRERERQKQKQRLQKQREQKQREQIQRNMQMQRKSKQQNQRHLQKQNSQKIQLFNQKQYPPNPNPPKTPDQKPQQKLIPKSKQHPNSMNSSGNHQNQLRGSDKTFTFKQNYEEDNQSFSPPKREAKINVPNPNPVGRISRNDSGLAYQLERRVDKKVVEKQLETFKKQNKMKQIGEFRQLSEYLTNRQKQIQNTNFKNYFRQPLPRLNDQKFQDFYTFCQLKTQQLLLQNFNNQKSTKNWLQHTANKNGVKVVIIPSELKQIPGNSNICDEGLLKRYLNKMKNMDYIWKVVTSDEALVQVFLLPMCCVVEYQGVVAFFCCLFDLQGEEEGQGRNRAEKVEDFSQYFQLLCAKTKISKSILQNTSCIKFTKYTRTVQLQTYQNQQITQFIISQISQFLPRLTSINCQIRPEMFQRVSEQLPASTMSSISPSHKHANASRMENSNSYNYNYNYNAKINKKQEEQQNKYFKQPIEDTLKVIAVNLDRLDQYVIHPSQFSQLMHLYGLNIVYIQDIYKRVQNTFMKSIIKTQAFLRSFKTIYRKKMQQTLLSIPDQPPPNTTNTQKQPLLTTTTKSLLNILLNKPQFEQTAQLWSIVALHSQINFKLPVEREEINRGYLFLGLEHHLGIKIQTMFGSCEKIFGVEGFVDEVRFVPKVKPCQLYWIDQGIYSLPHNQAADSLINQLQLKKKQIPFHIYQNRNVVQKIYQIISLYHNPNSPVVRHLHIYKPAQNSSQLTLFYFRRKISQIKWLIKIQQQMTPSLSQSLPQITTRLQQLKQSLLFYFGQYHPFYTQIYDILMKINQSCHNYPQAEQNSKQSLANMLQLCGGNTMHIKLANNYYQRGEFYQSWGRVDQAVANYRKARNILEFNQYERKKEYAVISMKLGALYLIQFKDAECSRMMMLALGTFTRLGGIDVGLGDSLGVQASGDNDKTKNRRVNVVETEEEQQQEISSDSEQLQLYTNIKTCIQYLSRCQQSFQPLTPICLSLLQQCLHPQYPLPQIQLPDSITTTILKILLQNYFLQSRKQITQQFLNYVQLVCDEIVVGAGVDPSGQLEFVKELCVNGLLMETLEGFGGKGKTVLEMFYRGKGGFGAGNARYKYKEDKKIANFERLIKAVVVVFGEGFIFGVLNDRDY